MSKEVIHLLDGSTIRAEVNGKTLDGSRGHVLIWVNAGNLRRTLAESVEIQVRRRADGEWEEVRETV